ncbi:MAG: hypothetical protein IPG91_02495 [Ideonella sp.]|nr:hypothetical protein [Ideonella sp.]
MAVDLREVLDHARPAGDQLVVPNVEVVPGHEFVDAELRIARAHVGAMAASPADASLAAGPRTLPATCLGLRVGTHRAWPR